MFSSFAMLSTSALSPPQLHHSQVVVLGAGESGLAMAQWLLHHRATVTVADSRPRTSLLPLAQPLIDLGVNLLAEAWSDRHNDSDFVWLSAFDFVAVSPGIEPHTRILRYLNRTDQPIVGELSLFLAGLAHYQPNAHTIGITGSNGKTTTTTLIGKMLEAAGISATVAGNIRPSLLNRLLEGIKAHAVMPLPQAWVLELSSFQLARLNAHHHSLFSLPSLNLGALLNFSENHLDWHPTLDDYLQCKLNLLRQSKAIVVNTEAREWISSLRQSLPTFVAWHGWQTQNPMHPYPNSHFATLWREERGQLIGTVGNTPLSFAREDSPLIGKHHTQNLLAALSVTQAVVAEFEKNETAQAELVVQAYRGIHRFNGLAHRTQWLGNWCGVDWVNDSKSTTIASTEAALTGLDKPVLLLIGGKGKGQNFTAIRSAVDRYAKFVFAFGEDAPLIAQALEGIRPPVRVQNTLENALIQAKTLAVKGDCVLLSPACASFDQFRDYEHRGNFFIEAVQRIVAEDCHEK
jgi:UDP-N-acetylmuramoylalanine--D-glutamate ligase